MLLTLMFMVLLAFIGLATDAGILYVTYGQFRRAVDAAALAAASQYREARPAAQIDANALQFIQLQGFDPLSYDVEDCEEASSETSPATDYPPDAAYNTIANPDLNPDSTICTYPVRKLVRVEGSFTAHPVFLPILGFFKEGIDLTAEAVAEAASLELMLVIDTSPSMNSDNAGSGTLGTGAQCATTDYGASGLTQGTELPNTYTVGGVDYSPVHSCRPFEWVRDAAVQFVDQYVKFPFDRVGIVAFSNTAVVLQSLSDTGADDKTATLTVLKGMDVSTSSASNPPNELASCGADNNAFSEVGLYGTCAATNTGDGLNEALTNLTAAARQNALRFIILLSDGAVNGSADDSAEYFTPDGRYACPLDVVEPSPANLDTDFTYDPYMAYPSGYDTTRRSYFRECQDGDARNQTRHDPDDALYDADDYARDQADLIVEAGNTIVFTIGLGNEVTWNPNDNSTPACPVDAPLSPANSEPNGFYYGYGGTDGQGAVDFDERMCNADNRPNGEQLLRYIADAGDGDGTGSASDPCGRVSNNLDPNWGLYLADVGESCGNYFYAQTGAELRDLFDEIAENIFTRITR